MDADYLKTKHESGLPYEAYIQTGEPHHLDNWTTIYEQQSLTEEQRRLVRSFRRKMNVIAVSGIWCGDCVQQGPLVARIAEANPEFIDLRWLDRDEHIDLQKEVRINAGNRVPVLIFCAEDYELVNWYGDRSLSRYRAMAEKQLGAACPLPGAPVAQANLDAELSDWLKTFLRVYLLLRLSGRLRQKHGD